MRDGTSCVRMKQESMSLQCDEKNMKELLASNTWMSSLLYSAVIDDGHYRVITDLGKYIKWIVA